ncbi:MAG: RNA polymerase sporulation sigma factor SigK [Clostridiales bacterium]|nr:RNA polymerase sporulation sigma factor SigK [Clostridiales bacterium]MDY4111511.1 RNA polymerase sporulation sigma factor SigK [Roseburia sp.]
MKTFLSPFTPEQENDCLQKMKNGDQEAKKELILRNMRLVAHVAKKYQNSDEDMEDLISIGTIGLMKAIATYKENYGSRLATYAARCIDNELLMHFRAKKKTSREVSLYEPIGTDKEGNQISLLDIVESEELDVVEELEKKRQTRKMLELVPAVLNERERFIVSQRYGLYDKKPMTQREIAAALGISRSYVSRIEKRALEKLRKNFQDEKNQSFL